MGELHGERIRLLQERLAGDGFDYYIVWNADPYLNEYIDDHYKYRDYLSGFTGSNGTLLVGRKESILWTDGRYYIQAEKELKGSGVELYKMQEKDVPSLTEYLAAHAAGGRVGMDGSLISRAEYEELTEACPDTVFDLSADYAGKLWEGRPAETARPIRLLPKSIAGKTVGEKLKEVIKGLCKQGADILMLSDMSDIMWLFNIRGDDIRYSPLARSYAFVSRQKTLLFVDGCCAGSEIYAAMQTYGVTVRPLMDIYSGINMPKDCVLACDKNRTNARLFALRAKGNSVLPVNNHDLIRKAVKNRTEIKNARKFHLLDGAAITEWIFTVKKKMEAGENLREYEAAKLAENIKSGRKGYLGESFETICAFRENGAIVHYKPAEKGSKKLAPEGFLLLDCGAQYYGATTDMTRTIALGPLTAEMKEDYTAVLKGHLQLMRLVFLKGSHGENLDLAAREPIWERFIDYRHGTGHGVGSFLCVHEGPQSIRFQIRENAVTPALEEGMILSDEPGIYRKGKYGIRIENLLLCVQKRKNEWGTFLGFEPLTFIPYEREAILRERLTAPEKETLNLYHRAVYEALKEEVSPEAEKWLREVCAEI
ncbi:MAG: aminopeptidase P family protein [Lachnospiraceae bacterium]|nr:aminopeptidase P family protein [Lachnospiraceae bacterium]